MTLQTGTMLKEIAKQCARSSDPECGADYFIGVAAMFAVVGGAWWLFTERGRIIRWFSRTWGNRRELKRRFVRWLTDADND